MNAMHVVLPVTLPDVPCEVDINVPVAQTKAARVFGSIWVHLCSVSCGMYRGPSLLTSLKTRKHHAVRRGQMSSCATTTKYRGTDGDGTSTPYSIQYLSSTNVQYNPSLLLRWLRAESIGPTRPMIISQRNGMIDYQFEKWSSQQQSCARTLLFRHVSHTRSSAGSHQAGFDGFRYLNSSDAFPSNQRGWQKTCASRWQKWSVCPR